MIKNISPDTRLRVLIVIIGLLLFLPFNGLVHLFDWDEINFAESAREMIVTRNYSTVSINLRMTQKLNKLTQAIQDDLRAGQLRFANLSLQESFENLFHTS